jgi:hypothetical protein
MGRRDRERVPGIVPVRIWGTNREGQPFSEHVCTVNISSAGARVVGVRTPLTPGDTIGVQYRARQARFQIVWVIDRATSGGSELGLQCLQPEKHIWQTDLPEPAPDKYEVPDVRPRNCERRYKDRRSHTRFPISGCVFIAGTRGTEGMSAKLGDISLTGCYVETSDPWQAGSAVTLLLKIGTNEIRAAGVVRVHYPGVAMGIEFTHLNPSDLRILNNLISKLELSDAAEAPLATISAQSVAVQQLRLQSGIRG